MEARNQASNPILEQQHPPEASEDFDVAARIEQLEGYLEDPRYDRQKDNIRAALHCYREGMLPTKHGEPLIFQGGKLIELNADNLMNNELIWFEEPEEEDELEDMEEDNPDL